VAEDEFVVALESGPAAVLPELLGERLRKRDRAPAFFGLRVTDAQDRLDEVGVAPAKSL
jgi:hypothetical protein